jgi:hypothetical protein
MLTRGSLVVVALAVSMCSKGGDAKPKVPTPKAAAPASSCNDWLDRTVKRFERLSEPRWRDSIVAAVSEGCTAIPQPLREAAAKATLTKRPDEAARILADAAQGILGDTCRVAEPLSVAREVAGRCPLPSVRGFPLGGELDTMRAADYLFLNALAKSLIQSDQYGPSAERLVLSFALSAAIAGETPVRHGQKK